MRSAGPARALTPAHGPERRKVLQAVALARARLKKRGGLSMSGCFHIRDKHINRDWEKRCCHRSYAGLDQLET